MPSVLSSTTFSVTIPTRLPSTSNKPPPDERAIWPQWFVSADCRRVRATVKSARRTATNPTPWAHPTHRPFRLFSACHTCEPLRECPITRPHPAGRNPYPYRNGGWWRKGGIGIGAAIVGFIHGNGAAFVDHVAVGRDDIGADDYTTSLTIAVGDDPPPTARCFQILGSADSGRAGIAPMAILLPITGLSAGVSSRFSMASSRCAASLLAERISAWDR